MFYFNYNEAIPPLEACHEIGLISEIDGEYHTNTSQLTKDLERSELLRFQNLHIIRFTNEEVIQSIEIVLKDLKEFIYKIPPT